MSSWSGCTGENIPASYFCDDKLTGLPGGSVLKDAAGTVIGAAGISGLAPSEDMAIAKAMVDMAASALNKGGDVMSKPSVYVTRLIPEQNIDALRAEFDVEVNPDDRALTRDELKAKVRGRDAVVSLLTDTIDGEVLDAAGPQLKIVANYAVGYNNFDLAAATQRKVILTQHAGLCSTTRRDAHFHPAAGDGAAYRRGG
ncbi:MAG: heme-binding protein [Aliidongia sp.]